ncbi:MAG: transcriptional regulator [Campylobacteraceae bacterium 4484_166]|nr:MAG: transcriptional regulator [Campylobacteraceae bacterium 4484_166]
MLLTKKSEYALMALIYISEKNEAISVDTISNDLNISKTYLAKVLQKFNKKNIISSKKGKNGGFVLSKDPKDIDIYNIVKIAESSDVVVFDCSISIGNCNQSKIYCQLWPMFNNLQTQIDGFLKKLSLKDII